MHHPLNLTASFFIFLFICRLFLWEFLAHIVLRMLILKFGQDFEISPSFLPWIEFPPQKVRGPQAQLAIFLIVLPATRNRPKSGWLTGQVR